MNAKNKLFPYLTGGAWVFLGPRQISSYYRVIFNDRCVDFKESLEQRLLCINHQLLELVTICNLEFSACMILCHVEIHPNYIVDVLEINCVLHNSRRFQNKLYRTDKGNLVHPRF